MQEKAYFDLFVGNCIYKIEIFLMVFNHFDHLLLGRMERGNSEWELINVFFHHNEGEGFSMQVVSKSIITKGLFCVCQR